MKLQLPDSVASKQDLLSLILEVRDYTRWYAHNAIKKQAHAKHHSEAPEISPAANEVLRSWTAKQPLTRDNLESLVVNLEQYAETAPVITVTLAAPPTGGIKQPLTNWLRSNLGHNVLVSYQFNSTLLGGMVVRVGSRIFDWSFRRKILDNLDAFPGVLRNV